MLELSYISYLFYKGYAEQGRSPHAGFAERSYVKLTFLDVARLCRAKLPTATPYKARSAKHCRSVAGDRVKAIATKPFLGLIAVLVWRGFARALPLGSYAAAELSRQRRSLHYLKAYRV